MAIGAFSLLKLAVAGNGFSYTNSTTYFARATR